MNANTLLRLTLILACMASPCLRAPAAADEGVALAILYDNSGSMKQSVRDANGRQTPKYVIARRALESVIHRLQNFATNTPRKIEAGLDLTRSVGGEVLEPMNDRLEGAAGDDILRGLPAIGIADRLFHAPGIIIKDGQRHALVRGSGRPEARRSHAGEDQC